MPKVDKNATPAYEIVGTKVLRHRVVSDELDKDKLEKEKAYLEQRLAEINEILGGSNG